MEIKVELDKINTKFLPEVPANISVKVYLDTIWTEIKQYNRIYLSAYLSVPTMQGRIENIVLHEYFNISEIVLDITGTYVKLKGYVEGDISNTDIINSYCYVWSYNCI